MTYLNTKEAAEYLGLKPSTLEQWGYLGKGPIFRKHGRLVVYAESDLIIYSNTQIHGSNSAANGHPY